MKQIDNHRYIDIRETVVGDRIALLYRVPYKSCFGRQKVKLVEVAYRYIPPLDSYDALFRDLEMEAKNSARERAEWRRTKKMSKEDRIAHGYREFLKQQNDEYRRI